MVLLRLAMLSLRRLLQRRQSKAFLNRSRRLQLNAQYGVSLEDVGTGLAALAQLGIKAQQPVLRRNMYADLSGVLKR